MINFFSKGSWDKTDKFLKKSLKISYNDILEHYAKLGVERLKEYTPIDSGETRESWYYEIEKNQNESIIRWNNRNIVGNSINVAVLIQRGHGTRSGVYVEGTDYINPAIKPIFEDIANKIFKEVAKI